MGDGGEGGIKDRGNGAGAGYDVQGICAVGVSIQYLELGGERGHTQSARDIP